MKRMLVGKKMLFYRRDGVGFKIEIDGNQIGSAQGMEFVFACGLGWLYNLMMWLGFFKKVSSDVWVLCCQ